MIQVDKIESLDINEIDDLKLARIIYSLNKSIIRKLKNYLSKPSKPIKILISVKNTATNSTNF